MTRNFGIVPGFAPGLAHCRSSPLFHRWLRAVVTPAHRGVGSKGQGADQSTDKPITARHVALMLPLSMGSTNKTFCRLRRQTGLR